MIFELCAIALTLFFGPVVFYLWAHKAHRGSKLNKYPVGIIDSLGDIVFLPFFNCVLAYLGFVRIEDVGMILIGGGLAFLVTAAFVHWRRDIAIHNDWTRPKKGRFNNAGWYHTAFMIMQAFLVFYGLITYYRSILIWIPIAGYVLTVIIRLVQLHFRSKLK